jgi:hypothetical protein
MNNNAHESKLCIIMNEDLNPLRIIPVNIFDRNTRYKSR